MHWLVQNNIYSEDGFEALITALERQSCTYSVHKCVPFAGTLEPPAPDDVLGPVVVMGSYTMARHARDRGWTPGAWLENLDFRIQADRWGPMMFNYESYICTFGSVPEQEQPFFMRPVHDTKSFSGAVFDYPYYVEWRDMVRTLNDPDGELTVDTLVMVCKKREIFTETRFWIVDGEVITHSQYKMGTHKRYRGPEFTSPEVVNFAQRVADIWSPNRAYVLDVFDTAIGPFIGEVNNLNSAGFYLGDMNKLVGAIEYMDYT